MKHAFSTSLAVCIFSLAGLSDAASIVISEPAIPRSYEGFTAQVTFDAPYCVSAAYPLIGEGELRADLFSITLSHLKPGACGNTFRVSVPGLPAQVVAPAARVEARLHLVWHALGLRHDAARADDVGRQHDAIERRCIG